MHRLQAFLSGINKEAAKKSLVTPAALLGSDITWALLLGTPLLAGAGVGALASKMTSPKGSLRTAQKELVLSEMEQALVELRRQRDVAHRNEMKSNKALAYNERPLHI